MPWVTNVAYEFSGGDRGWKGDVPVVRLIISKIRSLGWALTYSSKAAVIASLTAMKEELQR